jgi:hypothetical protein
MSAKESANAKNARKPSRRRWSRAVEQASIAMREPLLPEALRNYEAIDDLALKLELAREIAETRGAELTLAYRNVVMVASGFKQCTQAGEETLVRTPCVIFVVRRKWEKSASDAADPQHLPYHLLAYATWKGRRLLVAVPTDVQIETRFAKAIAHSEHAICARPQAHADEYGTITAIVDVRVAGEVSRYGLTAMHVLSRDFAVNGGGPEPRVPIEHAKGEPQPDGERTIGESLAIGGRLVPGPAISLDAQLFKIDDEAEIVRMLQRMPLSPSEPYINDPARLNELVATDPPTTFEVLIAQNNPKDRKGRPRARLFASFMGWAPLAFLVNYELPKGDTMPVHHRELIRMQCIGGMTVRGDSGSPVVAWIEEKRCALLGMHIAGDGALSYVLPAWYLFFPGSYSGTLPEDSEIVPVALE